MVSLISESLMSSQASPSIGRAVHYVLSVDVEDYFQVEAFAKQISRSEWDRYPSRVVANTHRLLDLFDEFGSKGTYFVLGWVAQKFPSLVREIHQRGHEVACHSFWALRERAKPLRQASGGDAAVWSSRAHALGNCGCADDSVLYVFPAGTGAGRGSGCGVRRYSVVRELHAGSNESVHPAGLRRIPLVSGESEHLSDHESKRRLRGHGHQTMEPADEDDAAIAVGIKRKAVQDFRRSGHSIDAAASSWGR